MSFGRRLRDLRVENELTQQDLAQKLNLSKANISKYEADIIQPSIETLVSIARLFKISVDYLLGLSEARTAFGNYGISIRFNFEEEKLIAAYRKKTNMQEAVKRLLLDEPDDEMLIAADIKKSVFPKEEDETTIL